MSNQIWKKKIKEGFSNWQDLSNFLNLPSEYKEYYEDFNFPMRVPITYAKLMKKGDIKDPLLMQCLSTRNELLNTDSNLDPLKEDDFLKISGLLHKYDNRVLLITNGTCAINCRYCFRRNFDYKSHLQSKVDWKNAFDYIKENNHISEVILSGGDPLMHNDNMISFFINECNNISHVSTIRIHSRIPTVLPERITDDLINIFSNIKLKKIIVTHINHPNEISELAIEKFKKITANGFVLLNQSTLLKGVNDNPNILKQLSEKLFHTNILPYYLHTLDQIKGNKHFLVSDAEASEIHHKLKSIVSGYLVPKLVKEIAYESSKVWINK